MSRNSHSGARHVLCRVLEHRWAAARSGIVRLVAALQRQEGADVIVLAECSDGVQVLIRPSLLPYYRDDSVCIVTRVEGTALAGADLVPNRRIGSDHYPIRVRLTD